MRYRNFAILIFATILVTSIFLVSARPRWKDPCPINSDTNIVFYGETGFGGVGDLSRSWMIHFLSWWEQQDPSINYEELTDEHVTGECDLVSFSNLKIYIQPGGNAYYQQRKLGPEGRQNILNLIDSGKAYFGVCAGFFYAANDYYWQGEYYNHPDMLDRFPTVEGSITDIADYEGSPDHALTPLSNGRNAIYYGGPTVGWRQTSSSHPGITDATFSAIPGDLPAVIKYGNMLLTSVHLEAYENEGITGLETADRIENYKYLANLLNEVAQTSFYVPPYSNPPVCGNNILEYGETCDGSDLNGESCLSQGFDAGTLNCLNDCSGFDTNSCVNYPKQCADGLDNDFDNLTDMEDPGCSSPSDNDETDTPVTQCSDGLDNDGDSLVDLADPGCENSEDDDEYNVPGPTEAFFDGFESGFTWSTYGSGSVWIISTDTSYEGSRSARAKKTGVGKDSFMETTIDLSGYSSATLEYYRKLVGLDTADDFQVEYYDGTWKTLEHLGSGRASDSSFKKKSYTIPTSTTKIRFKCECGAVSEKCYVDNVKVIAE